MNNNSQHTNGYIAIASMLVIAAVVFIIGTSTSLLSVNEVQSSLSAKKSDESLNLVEGCVEDALLNLNENNTIDTTITIPDGSCSVTINSQSGSDWTFTVSASFENYTKSIQVSASRGSSVGVVSWIEI